MALIESIVDLPAECTLFFHPGCIYDTMSNTYIYGPIGATGCRGLQGLQGPAQPRDPEEERKREEEERKRMEEYKKRYKSGVIVHIPTPTGPLFDSFNKLVLDYQNEHPGERLQIIAKEPRPEVTKTLRSEHLAEFEQRNQLRAKRDSKIRSLIAELEELGYQNDETGYGWTKYPEEEMIPAEWYNVTTSTNYTHSGFEIRCHCESTLYKTLVEKGLYDEKKVTARILGQC